MFYEALFHAIDVDRNGYIDKREFVSMCGRLRANELASIATSLEADRVAYGRTVLEQAMKFFDNVFDSMDLDGNGRIDKQEFLIACGRLQMNELISIAETFNPARHQHQHQHHQHQHQHHQHHQHRYPSGDVYAAQQRGGPEPSERRGVCAVCHQPVLVSQTRTKDHFGRYTHQACSPLSTVDAQPAQPDPAQIRGYCCICHRHVLTTQEREKDENGRYLHRACKPDPAHVQQPRSPPVHTPKAEQPSPAAPKLLSQPTSGAQGTSPHVGQLSEVENIASRTDNAAFLSTDSCVQAVPVTSQQALRMRAVQPAAPDPRPDEVVCDSIPPPKGGGSEGGGGLGPQLQVWDSKVQAKGRSGEWSGAGGGSSESQAPVENLMSGLQVWDSRTPEDGGRAPAGTSMSGEQQADVREYLMSASVVSTASHEAAP